MSLSYQIIQDLYALNRNFCSTGYDKAVQYLHDLVPGKVHTFQGEPVNGWQIPNKWDLQEAWIKKEGQMVWDGTAHPLRVISNSAPFEGTVALEELKKHLHTQTYFWKDGSATPFHFRQLYQPWKRDWGFCMPKDVLETLEEGEYAVKIATQESEGYLKVLEIHHQGESDQTFCFVAHLDHPGMANDDLAGVAVGMEFFAKLKDRSTKFSYKLLIVQEIVGSEYYLQSLSPSEKENLVGGLFLEMLGSKTQLALQDSHSGLSILEKALQSVLADEHDFRQDAFGKVIGNDEIVFEAHNIPMASLSRFPFPEYHTDKDNLAIISKESLAESVTILEQLVDTLEQETLVVRNFEGLMCLSNPNYELYVDTSQLGEHRTQEGQRWRQLMDYLGLMSATTSVRELAEKFELNQADVAAYLNRWAEKGLLKII